MTFFLTLILYSKKEKLIDRIVTIFLSCTGHELPYAIRMNHIRTLYEYTHDENDNHYEQTSGTFDDDGKLQFVLKKAKKGNTRNNIGKSQLFILVRGA